MGKEVNGILVAAHELKAPLSLMRQLALSLELTDDSAIQERIRHQIIGVSERALRQVNDLAKIARLEDGLFAMEPVSVRGVCESVLQDIDPLFSHKHKSLSISYRNRQKLAIANTELLYSVVYNFCVNAIHYSDDESNSMLSIGDSGEYIRVNVRDFGPALPNEIWRRFNHGGLATPSATAMRPSSSGLGLYISSQFASYMHARLGAVRHRDGTSFYVELPVSRQACLFP